MDCELVGVQAKKMKNLWCLLVNKCIRGDWHADPIVCQALGARRTSRCRRDVANTVARALLLLFRATNRNLEWPMLKTNTVKRRTHSLSRRGLIFYEH